MSELHSNLSELKNYLYLVLNNLNELDNGNFNAKMDNVNSLIKEIEKKRQYIKNNFNQKYLQGKSDLLHMMIKQISARFDDIIENKKKEQVEISSELNKLVNKKKIINYQR